MVINILFICVIVVYGLILEISYRRKCKELASVSTTLRATQEKLETACASSDHWEKAASYWKSNFLDFLDVCWSSEEFFTDYHNKQYGAADKNKWHAAADKAKQDKINKLENMAKNSPNPNEREIAAREAAKRKAAK